MPRVVEYFGQSLKAALSRRINIMVTFANLGSVRLPSFKFVGLRVRKIRRIQCVSCLSTTVSQLFEPLLQNNRHFYVPRPSFFVSPGEAPGEITLIVVWMEREFDAYKLSRSMYPSIFKCKKSPFSRTAAHILFPLETLPRLSRNMLHGWKDNSMLAKPLAAYTYLSSTVSELYDV